MFDHRSYLHGVGHTCRVMALSWVLGENVATDEERNAAWCAAYIHDLARLHDGVCHLHGQQAAENKLPLYKPFFIEQGLSEEMIEAVYTAVFQHSLPNEIEKDHPHYNVTALLKDADALDRIRLGPFDLNPDYLRYSYSRELIKPARKLFLKTTLIRQPSPIGCHQLLTKLIK